MLLRQLMEDYRFQSARGLTSEFALYLLFAVNWISNQPGPDISGKPWRDLIERN